MSNVNVHNNQKELAMTKETKTVREKPKTIEKIGPGDFSNIPPEFGRTPDARQVFGIPRGSLYNLNSEGKIRGVTLRVKGHKRGIRLWDMGSIRRYIHSQMAAAAVSNQ
jgi:hypothetical protein